MEQRTENFYVILIMIIGAFIAVFAIYTGVGVLNGSATKNPAYESAPSPFIVGVPTAKIVSPEVLNQYPISDQDFLYLHKTTRKLKNIVILLKTRPDQLRPFTISNAAAARISTAVNQQSSVLVGGNFIVSSRIGQISVLQSPKNKAGVDNAKTSFAANYIDKSSNASAVIITFQFFFEKPSTNSHWTLKEIRPVVAGSTANQEGLGLDTSSPSEGQQLSQP